MAETIEKTTDAIPHDNAPAHIKGATIILSSGRYFDFERPDVLTLTVDEIAHALSNICRFGGHSPFYSVAEHSVHVSHIVPCEDAYAGLMHDAAEALTGDIPKPLKRLLPDFQRIEANVEAAIARQFGLPEKMPPSVKAADLSMLAREQIDLFANRDGWASTQAAQPAKIRLHCFEPSTAKALFLARFAEVRP